VHRYDLERESQTAERRRLLVLTRVLASAYNLGYHDLGNLALKEINGRSVNSIAEADEAFRHPQDGLHRVVFEPEDLRWPVVLDAEGFESATEQLLEAYDVPTRIRTRDGSATAALEGCSVRPEER
jgi:hypothetical protein